MQLRGALPLTTTNRLDVPHFKLSNFGSRSFYRLTDLELTTRNSRFGINSAVVPALIENFPF